jgi:hypothetical protein
MPLILIAMIVACTAAAALAGQTAWAAACGATVVLVMWMLEKLTVRLGSRGTVAHGIGVGVAGMVVRMALAVGVLVAIGLAARPSFKEATFAFLASYTVYIFARLWQNPAVPDRTATDRTSGKGTGNGNGNDARTART